MLSSELSSENLNPVAAVEAKSFSLLPDDPEAESKLRNLAEAQSSLLTLAEARQLLRKVDCDPRVPNFFSGINLIAIRDTEMVGL